MSYRDSFIGGRPVRIPDSIFNVPRYVNLNQNNLTIDQQKTLRKMRPTTSQGFNFANPMFYAENMPRIITDKIDSSGKNLSSDARLKKVSVQRAVATANFWKTGGGSGVLNQANALRAQLGQKAIEVRTRRRRRGRYTTYTTGDPVGVLQSHQKKTSLVNWAKDYGLEIDPSKKVTIQTGIQTLRRNYTRTIHNGRRVSGYYYYDKPIKKQVSFKDAPSAYKTQFLFDKLKKESAEKKSRYVDLYDPIDADLKKELGNIQSSITSLKAKEKKMTFNRYRSGSPSARAQAQRVAPIRNSISKLAKREKELKAEIDTVQYSYYSIPESELAEAEKYKKDLITGIGNLNESQYEMANYLARDPMIDATSKIDDDSPKQRYLAFQRDPTSELGKKASAELTPIISRLRSRIDDTNATENANLQKAVDFVSGKARDFTVNSQIVAVRDNLGRVEIKDENVFKEYIPDLPQVYQKQEPDNLAKKKIAGLESEYEKEVGEYEDTEKELSYRQRAEAELGNVTAPRRLPSYFLRLQRSAGRRRR